MNKGATINFEDDSLEDFPLLGLCYFHRILECCCWMIIF